MDRRRMQAISETGHVALDISRQYPYFVMKRFGTSSIIL